MRLVKFSRGGKVALGLRQNASVLDLSACLDGLPSDLGAILRGEGPSLTEIDAAALRAPASALLPLEGLDLLAPIARPGKIICLGTNYTDHAAESGVAAPSSLVAFMRGGTSLGGNGQPIVLPNCSEQLDYEGELAVFMGKTGYQLTADTALSIVAGYAVFNDGSIRDYQLSASQWTLGKNFDGTGTVGDFVPAHELPPGGAGLRLQTRLNGKVMQEANTKDMVFDVCKTIVILTECMTLEPGDMIVMGTPGGVGLARKPPVFMKAGDVCEVEIERLGVLRNPIVAENDSKNKSKDGALSVSLTR